MKVRSSDFTLTLEECLRFMVRQPKLPIAYCARRFDVDKASIAAWLGEFNGGQRELTERRINEVIREVSGGKGAPVKESAGAVAPAAAPAQMPPGRDTKPAAAVQPPPSHATDRAYVGYRSLARAAARSNHGPGPLLSGGSDAGDGSFLARVQYRQSKAVEAEDPPVRGRDEGRPLGPQRGEARAHGVPPGRGRVDGRRNRDGLKTSGVWRNGKRAGRSDWLDFVGPFSVPDRRMKRP